MEYYVTNTDAQTHGETIRKSVSGADRNLRRKTNTRVTAMRIAQKRTIARVYQVKGG